MIYITVYRNNIFCIQNCIQANIACIRASFVYINQILYTFCIHEFNRVYRNVYGTQVHNLAYRK